MFMCVFKNGSCLALMYLAFCVHVSECHECSPCALRACPRLGPLGCDSARVLARDPCGCCEQCSRLELELCAGPDWTLGYCGSGLTCAALNRTGPALIPETGVCKVVPDATDEDERCPLVSGCDRVNGECVCESKHSCIRTYSFPNRDACLHTGKTDSPRCVHNGKDFAEGDVHRMDSCWLCQCRAGISFCTKDECAEPVCDNFYVPEGECCPVCIDVELLSLESTKASCWMDHKLRAHDEQWKEDDCTFCQCVDGEPHCTAMACKQSCQNPVKIPGECCPFCEEPSYETVSPLLCPPLENCSLSGHDCPFGFQQDPRGCLLCQCVSNDTCPDLSSYCSLECPLGYQKDHYGCDVCECRVPNCRPMTCSKTCPNGYVRNKHGCEMCRCVKCPPFTCDKRCSDGYRTNRKGCSICECNDHRVSSTMAYVQPLPSYCLTQSGRRFEEGDSWHDGCRDCYCHAGREMCVLISCPVPTCANPVLGPDQCCPSCDDESGSGEVAGIDMVVCRAPDGELYVEGETWSLDECTRCTCRQGRVLCDSEVCPPVLCHAPINKDTCCHTCPEDKLNPKLPVNNSQQEYCISTNGEILLAGESWKSNACTSCTCHNGTVECFSQHCPPASCRLPVLRKGQCCPHCLEGTTTSVPIMLSTAATKPNAKPTATVTEIRTARITTVAPVIAVTDDRGASRDAPSQMEMTLIYQSAAWILAGILLAIVIFLIVAVLVNRRKNWVQMSCYGAPKKMVILKMHVNKNSVVYMEPSKDNKFQTVKSDCTANFPLDVGSSCPERIAIPRAKLANGHARVQR